MKLLVLGNLLLDTIASVEPDFLRKFNLVPDSIQMVKESTHLANVFVEVLKIQGIQKLPGGSALNTVRMANRIIKGLEIPNANIILVGAVGNDENGSFLIDTVEREGIHLVTQKVKNSATGRCVCLLTEGGSARTMVTDMGASLLFDFASWKSMESKKQLLMDVQFIYVSGYFLKVSPETVRDVVESAKARNAHILLNLNAVWVTTSCKTQLVELLPLIDVLFGNEQEVSSFCKEIGFENENASAVQMATWLSLRIEKLSTVIVTRNKLPVIAAKNGTSQTFTVPTVQPEDMRDSTGAGDAFVGGFLACYVQNMELEKCISCAIWAATEELKGYGFILPSEIPNEYKISE